MRQLLRILPLALLSCALGTQVYGQSPVNHQFGLSFQKHSFEAQAQKSELKLSYHLSPHPSFIVQTNIGLGTFGNKMYSDGFLHLKETYSISGELQLYPLYKLTQQKKFVPRPYLNLGYGLGTLLQDADQRRMYQTMNLGLGLNMAISTHTCAFISAEQQSGYGANPMIDQNFYWRIGLSYSFHIKEQKEVQKQYDDLTLEFMNSVKSKEEVQEQKAELAVDKQLMEGSYEAMLSDAQAQLTLLQAALKESRSDNELLRNDNFELELQLERLKRELATMVAMASMSNQLTDYQLNKNWGNPLQSHDKLPGSYYYLRSDASIDVLWTLRNRYLKNYENTYLFTSKDGMHHLVVKLDHVGHDLNFELQQLKTQFPRLFKFVGNDS